MTQHYVSGAGGGPGGLPPEVPEAIARVLRDMSLGPHAPNSMVPIGRWGYRLFESDQDLDIALIISRTLCGGDECSSDDCDRNLGLSKMVHQSDMCAPPHILAHYKTNEYKEELSQYVEKCRKNLNKGPGDQLMREYRAHENETHSSGKNGKYMVIVVGALLMRAGVKIRDDDLQHLRDLASQVHCSTGRCSTENDWGFRAPGMVQFLAALDHYKPGVPRSFHEPSCFTCGKISQDIDKKGINKCAKCERAWYCDKDCQKSDWATHKRTCIEPSKVLTLNV